MFPVVVDRHFVVANHLELVTVDNDPENRITVLSATSQLKIKPGSC